MAVFCEQITNEQTAIATGDRPSHDYTDGTEQEEFLLRVIGEATDLSVGSEELETQIGDWSSEYHLSSRRADLMRPFQHLLTGKNILEIGSGCGAITRFLAESKATVTALEGSKRRARITALRCRDLSNVSVTCSDLQTYSTQSRFDIVTLIGVLEYSSLYSNAENAALETLQIAYSLLKENGLLIIAIENKLGLKYWAGSPEDHLAQPYAGLEDRYKRMSPRTFGKFELSKMIADAEFGRQEFFFPFPDYKFPRVLLSSGAFHEPALNLVNLLQPNLYHRPEQGRSFHTENTLRPLLDNDIMSDLANSFCVLCSKQDQPIISSRILAYAFSSGRKYQYNKLSTFVKNEDATISVSKIWYRSAFACQGNSMLEQEVLSETYLSGDLYTLKLSRLLTLAHWQVDDIITWSVPYFNLIRSLSIQQNGELFLDGKYVDLVPFNVISNHGTLTYFDLEWKALNPVPLWYVFFRGLYHCLYRLQAVSRPAEATPLTAFELIPMVLSQLMDIPADIVSQFISMECLYFEGVIPNAADYPKDFTLNVACNPDATAINAPGNNRHAVRPLEEIRLQVFFHTADNDFEEVNSIVQHVRLTPEKNILTLSLPETGNPITRVRIDPTDQPGLIQMPALSIKNAIGDVLYNWSPLSTIPIQLEEILLVNPGVPTGETVMVLMSADPKIVINVPVQENAIQGSVRVDIELTSLTPSVHQLFKTTLDQLCMGSLNSH